MNVAFPNESNEYRAARNKLLEQEIELRRTMEAVAATRRQLPPGGEIPEDTMCSRGQERRAPRSTSGSRSCSRPARTRW
jgi:predicted dithiol-disulfide oxidoreductase (DUF899 family)